MFILGLIAGIIITGVVAHNRPEWFADVLQRASDLENKIQDSLKDEEKK